EIVMRRDMVPMTRMARHRMVRDERWKLVYVPTRKGVKYMLFDTAFDPGEVRDVAASNPSEVTRLRTELWSWMLRDPQMEQKDGFLVPRAGAGP
ncbi:MAG: Choline-sulfatase, partial [Labilithrix sp.]|nr:Choline-sulfatase [Labilithrix sp.]